MQLQNITTKTGMGHTKGSLAENDRQPERGPEDPRPPRSRPCRQAHPTAPAFPGQSKRGTARVTADS